MKLQTVFSLITIVLASGIFSGCASAKVVSNRDPELTKDLERIFVLIDHGEVTKQQFSGSLSKHLAAALTNVTVKIAIVSPLELDEKAHQHAISEFAPDAVLVIKCNGGVLHEYGGYLRLTYDVSLYDSKQEKRLWRAAASNDGGTAVMEKRLRVMADEIVVTLQRDGFLKPAKH